MIADLQAGPLPHLPFSRSPELELARGTLAASNLHSRRRLPRSLPHARAAAATVTVRTRLIASLPDRSAKPAGDLHLAGDRPWRPAWSQLFCATVHGPPPPTGESTVDHPLGPADQLDQHSPVPEAMDPGLHPPFPN